MYSQTDGIIYLIMALLQDVFRWRETNTNIKAQAPKKNLNTRYATLLQGTFISGNPCGECGGVSLYKVAVEPAARPGSPAAGGVSPLQSLWGSSKAKRLTVRLFGNMNWMRFSQIRPEKIRAG